MRLFGLELDDVHRPHAAKVLSAAKVEGLDDTVRFEWSAFDAWFEEDEQVFVHPRSPYTRVDVLRSSRRLRVESKGVVLAETSSPVMLFETGLPTRYYLNRTDVDFTRLVPSDTVTACPYKGTTSGYWSATVKDAPTPTSPGPTTSPPARCSPSRGSSPSTTRRSTSSSTGNHSSGPQTQFGRSGNSS